MVEKPCAILKIQSDLHDVDVFLMSIVSVFEVCLHNVTGEGHTPFW